MRDDHEWPGRDPEPSAARAAPQAYSSQQAARDEDLFVRELLNVRHITAPPTRGKRFRRGVGKVFMIVGGVFAVFALLYLADLMLSVGDVPRGVTVANVHVGGLDRDEAEAKLRRELEPRLTDPIPIRAGDVATTLDPNDAGLGIDWASTLEQAGNQPLDPVTRVRSFFTSIEVGIVATANDDRLRSGIESLAASGINHPVTEGDIAFRTVDAEAGSVRAYAIEPRQAQRLRDVKGAMELVKQDWLAGGRIELPVEVTPAKATAEGVRTVLNRTVEPMVAGPIRVRGDGAEAVLRPVDLSEAMDFRPLEDGRLEMSLDRGSLRQVLRPKLDDTERPAEDARIIFTGGEPSIKPSRPGKRIDWQRTFAPLVEVASAGDNRELSVAYLERQPLLNTGDAESLGIKEVIGEFTTGGMSGDVAHNVGVMAEAVNGTIVRPGETFSLDERTGARTASQGYVVAPVNEHGTGERVIGGGVNQFTSTLYNAAYLAGLDDAGHTAHPFYLSRYPLARDAISLRQDGSSVDLAFRNGLPKGVAIQAQANGSSVTVRIWGTRHYRVESETGDRTGFVSPPTRRSTAPSCEPSPGTPGFTVSDTRVRHELRSNRAADRRSQRVEYAPRPRVVCAEPDREPSRGRDPGPRRP